MNRLGRGLPMLLACLALAACGTAPRGGGYYLDDGPDASPVDVSKVPDAVPRHEPRAAYGNKPYVALGQRYTPMTDTRGYRERGIASWYGKKFHGRRTSSGEPYDMYAMTAAHKTLPLPSYVRVRNLQNGRTVVVRVNDRGPFLHNRLIDLSYAAAWKLGIVATGTGQVEIEALQTDQPAPPKLAERPATDDSRDGGGRATPGAVAEPSRTGFDLVSPAAADDSRDGGRSGPSRPSRGITPSLEGRGRTTPGDGRDAEGRTTPGAVAGTAAESRPLAPVPRLYLQLGAFTRAENAEALRVRAERAALGTVTVLPGSHGGAALYRVRVGPLADAAHGERLTERAQALGFDRAKVVHE